MTKKNNQWSISLKNCARLSDNTLKLPRRANTNIDLLDSNYVDCSGTDAVGSGTDTVKWIGLTNGMAA